MLMRLVSLSSVFASRGGNTRNLPDFLPAALSCTVTTHQDPRSLSASQKASLVGFQVHLEMTALVSGHMIIITTPACVKVSPGAWLAPHTPPAAPTSKEKTKRTMRTPPWQTNQRMRRRIPNRLAVGQGDTLSSTSAAFLSNAGLVLMLETVSTDGRDAEAVFPEAACQRPVVLPVSGV